MKKMDVMEKLASMKMFETDEHGNVKLLPLKLGLPSGSTKNVQKQSNPDRSSFVSKEPIKPLNIWDLGLASGSTKNVQKQSNPDRSSFVSKEPIKPLNIWDLGLPSGSTKNVQKQSNPDRSSFVSKEPIKPLNIWDLGLASGSTKNVQKQSNPDRSSFVSKEPIKPLNIWDLNLHIDVNRNKTLVKGARKALFRDLPQPIPRKRVSVNKLTFPVGRRSLTRSDKSKAPMSRPTKKNVRISTTVSQRDSPKLLSPEESEQILSKVNSLKSAVKKMAILETVHENSLNGTANEQVSTPNSDTKSAQELDEFLQLEHFVGGATTLSAKLKIILRNYEKQRTMLWREYQEASDRQNKDMVQKIMELLEGDKENEKPTKNSIASCSKKSVDLRKTTLTKNSKAVELYNSLRMRTSVLGTPKG